jgi:hypothetical protein
MGDLFDASAMYDEDYLYFFAAPRGLGELAVHGPVVPDVDLPGEAAAELAWQLLDLRAGMSVLDLACGHGPTAWLPAAARSLALTRRRSSWTGPAPTRPPLGSASTTWPGTCASYHRGKAVWPHGKWRHTR